MAKKTVIALTTGIIGLGGAMATAAADGYVGRSGACCQLNWTGFYVGINGGYGFAAHDHAVHNVETFNGTFSSSANFGSLNIAGGFAGLQAGYNAQFGRWVLGIEADIQGGDISDKSHATVFNFLPGLNATVDTKNSVGWFGTVRPRLGYAWGGTLLYATGGVAWGAVRHDFRFVDNFNFIANDRTSFSQIGYVVGGGIEHKFSPRLSVKLEYQYIDLGSHAHKAPLFFVPAAVPIPTAFSENTDTDTHFHTVRVGLNYQLHDRSAAPLK